VINWPRGEGWGYITNLPDPSADFVIGAYHRTSLKSLSSVTRE
jgi:hypothetical protein